MNQYSTETLIYSTILLHLMVRGRPFAFCFPVVSEFAEDKTPCLKWLVVKKPWTAHSNGSVNDYSVLTCINPTLFTKSWFKVHERYHSTCLLRSCSLRTETHCPHFYKSKNKKANTKFECNNLYHYIYIYHMYIYIHIHILTRVVSFTVAPVSRNASNSLWACKTCDPGDTQRNPRETFKWCK